MSSITAKITLSTPPRGYSGPSLDDVVLYATEVQITKSWGLQPGIAVLNLVNQQPLEPPVPGSAVKIEVGGHTFYGVSLHAEAALNTGGHGVGMEFVDYREFLQWDVVYGAFNIRDHAVVNGTLVRRFKHLLPANVASGNWTYTDGPYSGAQVLALLLGSAWVESPWTISWMNGSNVQTLNEWHPALVNFPVFDVDWTGGIPLGSALAEISERVGLTFTIQGGAWMLMWVLRGDAGSPPWYPETGSSFPANSDNRRLGTRVSGQPSRVSVVGDRNLYQVLNVSMEKDWAAAWETYRSDADFVEAVYWHATDPVSGKRFPALAIDAPITGEKDPTPGWLAAARYANQITVGEWASVKGGQFADARRFGGRSRMSLPALMYLRVIVFKAFRVADGQVFTNVYGVSVDLTRAQIVSAAVQDVNYNPSSGGMTAAGTCIANGNGKALVKGLRLGDHEFEIFRPEYFDAEDWADRQEIWMEAPFNIDDSGQGYQCIIFDEPVVVSNDFITSEAGPDSRVYGVMNFAATMTVASVRAALVFACERFNYTSGTGNRDTVESVPGLFAEFTVSTPGGAGMVTEISFADGQTAGYKAQVIANALLNRQFWFSSGGYTVQGSNATPLTSVINRVTVKLSAGGLTEEVDFTAERPHACDAWGNIILEPPRQFDRRAMEWGQVPGLREQRLTAEVLRTQEAIYRLPENRRYRAEMWRTAAMMGSGAEPRWVTLLLDDPEDPPTSVFYAGVPLWRSGASQSPTLATQSDPVFVGAISQSNVPAAGQIPVAAAGEILVRVAGPVEVGDSVGYSAGAGHLEKDGSPAVGQALEAHSSTSPTLVRVRVGAASGGSVTIPDTYHPAKIYNSPTPTMRVSAEFVEGEPNVTLQAEQIPQLVRDAFADWLSRNAGEQYDIAVTGNGIPAGALLVGMDPLLLTLTISKPITASFNNVVIDIGLRLWNCFRVRAFSILRPVANDQPERVRVAGTDGLSWADTSTAPAVASETLRDSDGVCPHDDPDHAGVPPFHAYVDFFVPGYNAKTSAAGGKRWVYMSGLQDHVHVSAVDPGTTDVTLIALIDCDWWTNPNTPARNAAAKNEALIRQYVREDFTPLNLFRVFLCGDGAHEAGFYLMQGVRDPDQEA